METEIIITYCICDDMLKNLKIKDNPQVKTTNAKIITIAITTAMFLGKNQETTKVFLEKHNYIKNILSKSQFNKFEEKKILLPQQLDQHKYH